MNIKQLYGKLLDMEKGDCYKFTVDNRLITYITLTRWIDSLCFIVGGCNDTIKAFSITGNDESIVKAINEVGNYLFDSNEITDENKINLVKRADIKISINGLKSVKYGQIDNVIYEK